MKMKQAIGGVVVGALAMGGVLAVPAFAQESAPPPAAESSTGEARARLEAFRSDVLAELGLTADEVKAARTKVLDEHLTEAVASGRITQDQADRIAAAVAEGKGRALLRHRRG